MLRPHPLEFITSNNYVTGLGLNAPDENNSKLPSNFGRLATIGSFVTAAKYRRRL
jgi:hypothetical protein